MGIKENMHDLLESAQEHSATLCAIGAVAGVFVTAWLSGRAAVNVSRTIDPDMTRKDKVILYCKTYAATAVSAGITTGLIIGSDRIHVGKEAVLAAGAAIWKEKAMDLDNKIKEELGEEKANELKKKIVEEKLEGKSANTYKRITVYNPYSKQFIETTCETLAYAQLEMNRQLQTRFYYTVSAFDRILGGKDTLDAKGLGWSFENIANIDNWDNYVGARWIDVDYEVTTINGKVVLLLIFGLPPEDITYEIEEIHI